MKLLRVALDDDDDAHSSLSRDGDVAEDEVAGMRVGGRPSEGGWPELTVWQASVAKSKKYCALRGMDWGNSN